jgi:hypothetical protein
LGSQTRTAFPDALDGVGKAAHSGTIKAPYHSEEKLQRHLLKISRQKEDGKQMSAFLISNRDWIVPAFVPQKQSLDFFDLKLSNTVARLRGCGCWLLFGQHLKSGKVDLLRAQFCEQTYLCLFCQARRAYRSIGIYASKLAAITGHHKMVTLTIPNTADLLGGIQLLKASFRKLWDRAKQKQQGPFRDAIGAVISIEITVGKDGFWHPHIHAVVTLGSVSNWFPIVELRREWSKLTGGRQLRVNDLKSDLDLVEVLKYSVKPQQAGADGLGLCDRVRVWGLLAGKRVRMLQPYGCYKGTPEPDMNADFDIADFKLFYYRWLCGQYAQLPVPAGRLK